MRAIDPKTLGTIRFIDVPPGDAPIEFRQSWVGKEVKCLFRDDEEKASIDAVSGKVRPSHSVYVVNEVEALAVLKEASIEALEYWIQQGFPRAEDTAFGFDVSCAIEVKQVLTKQQFQRLYFDS